jgi:hypothetical protein
VGVLLVDPGQIGVKLGKVLTPNPLKISPVLTVIEPELIWSQATNPTEKLEHHSLLTHSAACWTTPTTIEATYWWSYWLVPSQSSNVFFFFGNESLWLAHQPKKSETTETSPNHHHRIADLKYLFLTVFITHFFPKLSASDRPLWLQILQRRYLSITFWSI